ncbi:glutathione-dependent formaldehyde dehydrogenase, partial [Pseudomonas aeruginosa]|jgi:threonine dehydrogenase-like Zn-dependent dehydrogenase
VFAIDRHPDRLHMARQQGAEVIDFEREDPVQALRWLTAGIGVDRAIDAVGVDAEHSHGTATPAPRQEGTSWSPGNAPAQALEWAVQGLAKAGTLSIIGVYAEDSRQFPIGLAMNRNLTIRMGNCHHRKYIPLLLEHVLSGRIDPAKILTQVKPIGDAIEAFEAFDRRETGWIKVELVPQKRQVEGSEERLDERAVDELARRPTPESGARG